MVTEIKKPTNCPFAPLTDLMKKARQLTASISDIDSFQSEQSLRAGVSNMRPEGLTQPSKVFYLALSLSL